MKTWSETFSDIKLFIHDPKENTYFTRTPKSWAQLITYYVLFFSFLAAYTALLCLPFFYTKYYYTHPYLTGLAVVPRPDIEYKTVFVTLHDSVHKKKYLDDVNNLLSRMPMKSSNCNYETGQRLNGTIYDACEFPKEILGPCSDPENYIKENKNVFGYVPDIKEKKITVHCQEKIKNREKKLGDPVYYPSVETVNGTMGYFSSAPFPYAMQSDYTTSLLAVTFPNIEKDRQITISCRTTNLANADEFRFVVKLGLKHSNFEEGEELPWKFF